MCVSMWKKIHHQKSRVNHSYQHYRQPVLQHPTKPPASTEKLSFVFSSWHSRRITIPPPPQLQCCYHQRITTFTSLPLYSVVRTSQARGKWAYAAAAFSTTQHTKSKLSSFWRTHTPKRVGSCVLRGGGLASDHGKSCPRVWESRNEIFLKPTHTNTVLQIKHPQRHTLV